MAVAFTVPAIQFGTTAGAFWTNADDTIPKRTACTGTIAVTSGEIVVTGAGTKFLTQVNPGMVLYPTTAKIRLTVARVDSDTRLYLEYPASGNVAAQAFGKSQPAFRYVRIKNTGGTAATINGEVIASSEELTFVPDLVSGQMGAVPVLCYDKAATTLSIITI